MDEAASTDLVFLDESGVDTRMVRRYGRSPRGKRARGWVRLGRYHRRTVVAALGAEGLFAERWFEGAMNTERFLAYVDECLIPALRGRGRRATVVMDNLAPHKAAAVREKLEAAGFVLLYLPPYSPDLSPIEPAWSKLKAQVRSAAATTADVLEAALQAATGTVTAQDACGWFRHCGYDLPAN